MQLTRSKVMDVKCPTCEAKEGQPCIITGDVMMIKQFKDLHWSRHVWAAELLFSYKVDCSKPNPDYVSV